MIQLLDKWSKNLWIYFICIIGVVTGIYLILNWGDLSVGARGAAFCAMIMPLHVIEEWKLPGGLHYIYNVRIFGPFAKDTHSLNRFPMSRLTDMNTNVGLTVVPLIYAWLSTIFTGIEPGLAICMMMFGYMELFAHTVVGIICLIRYKKAGKRTIYDPGLGTSIFCFLPASIYIMLNLQETSLMDWICSVILFIVLVTICLLLAEFPLRKWVRSLNSEYFAFESPKYFSKFVDVTAYPDNEVIIDCNGRKGEN